MDYESYATAVAHTGSGEQLKGKGKGKPAFKGKGKIKGKGKPSDKGKPTHVAWKGKGKDKGKSAFKGSRITPPPQQSASSIPQRPTDNSSTTNNPGALGSTSQPIRCHFCHKIGHYKNNFRQYLALRNHPSYYGDRLQQPTNMQLMYDHLEDSVFHLSLARTHPAPTPNVTAVLVARPSLMTILNRPRHTLTTTFFPLLRTSS
jgi:hypothetical protein